MKFINLLWKDLKASFYNKRIWMFFAIVSAIIIAGTYYTMKENNEKTETLVSIGVVDKDGSNYSGMLVNYFKESKEIAKYAEIIVGTENEIRALFEKKEIIGYLVIPEQFVQNLISIQNTPIQVVLGTENTTITVVLNNILKSYEKYISSVEVNCVGLYQIMQYEQRPEELIEKKNIDISMKLIFMALGRNDLFEIHEIESAEQVSLKRYYVQSLIVMTFLFGSIFVGFSYLREKENKTLNRLELAGISKLQYLFYKVIIACIGCNIALLFLYSIASIMAGVNIDINGYAAYSCCISACIFLSMFFAYLCKSTKIYMLVAGTAYFILYIVGGGIAPMMYMPRILYEIGQYSPVYRMLQILS